MTSPVLSGDKMGAFESSSQLDSFSDDEITTVEYLKVCFKPSYQIRQLKNKGAILVLVLNFLATSAFYYLSELSPDGYSYCSMCFKLILVPSGLVLTLAGWLADMRFGRYNVLYWSSLMMWLSIVLLVLSLVIAQVVEWRMDYIYIVFLVCLGMGYGGFQANIIQFGIDQLTDASTNEIVSFINWYSWSYVSSGVVVIFMSECTSRQLKLLVPFLLCVGLSALIILLFLCNNVLVKEPVTQNPFRLIHNVLKYALKSKHPQQRSAFTYCEDELPSRIDFGKSKYGGPFTTEQVEDVKTFFKLLGIVVIAGASFGVTNDKTFMQYILKAVGNQELLTPFSECFLQYFFTKTYYITIALLIPLNEFIIHPLFHHCLPKIDCYWRIFLGIAIHNGKYVVLMIFVTKARRYDLIDPSTNTTIQCIFQSTPVSSSALSLDYRLFAIPEIISAISFVLILVGAIEVLCAQVPYSMKGLVIGIFYGSMVFFLVLNNGIVQIFISKSYLWKIKSLFSCGFWYLQIKLIVNLITFFGSFLAAVCYKKRKRDDVLPNEQIFAERYYSQ